MAWRAKGPEFVSGQSPFFSSLLSFSLRLVFFLVTVVLFCFFSFLLPDFPFNFLRFSRCPSPGRAIQVYSIDDNYR